MNSRMKSVIAAATLGACATSTFAVTDDFNRAALGASWAIQAGSMSISANQVVGADQSLMTYAPGAGSFTASVDIFNDGVSTQYGAIVLGYLDVGHNAFIKVQNNGGGAGSFDTYGFYYGNNGGGEFGSITGLAAFTSARITATLSGSIATLSFDTNFDGIADKTLTHDYGALSFGSGAGLGIYGPARLDNFDLGGAGPIPEPETYALMLLGLAAVGAVARRRQR